MKKILSTLALASALALGGTLAASAQDTVKLALVQAISNNPLQVYAKQTINGFQLGLEYATKGTMTVKGKKIEVVEKDTQAKPDIARSMLSEAYADGALIAIGGTSSGATTAMLPVAAENEKILLVEAAVADSLTGPNSNKYIFKTSRNSSMDMQAQAIALKPDKNLYLATLAQDYAFGHDGINALKAALEGTGANVVDEEYIPFKTTDFTATIQRMIDALKDKPGRKVIFVNIAGIDAFTPLTQAGLDRYGIEISTGGFILPQLASIAKKLPGIEGAMYYHYQAPKNPINDWLVKEHEKRFGEPPDFFTCGGMAAAMAIVKALETADKWDTDTLIKTMAGMTWDTPKGPMTFRPQDHQALQDMFMYKMKVDPNAKYAVPEVVRVIKADEMKIPVGRDDTK
ncbi:MAG: substrate-binding domain-containing protein [Rhizobiaceae bacterium]|jgi:branched-chain amino acid transport system substrate-binding protein